MGKSDDEIKSAQNCDICICGNFYLIPSLRSRPQYLSGRGTVTIRGSRVGCNVALFPPTFPPLHFPWIKVSSRVVGVVLAGRLGVDLDI